MVGVRLLFNIIKILKFRFLTLIYNHYFIFLIPGWADGCLCFMCGGALFKWTESDIPFIEHAKYFPTCPYIRYVKGHAFIREQHSEYRTELD
jgi:hypothetical protein